MRCSATFLSIAIVVLLPWLAFAQGVTTGSLSGTVRGSDNKGLVGATVKAINSATGALYGAISKADGRYTIRGLRPGSYSVTSTFVGYKPQSIPVSIEVGETTTLGIVLQDLQNTTSEVVVVAERSSVFDKSKTGSGMDIDQSTISAAPTINRSISDIARINPYANQSQTAGSDGLQGISVGGVNSRFNNFQIDGAVANDVFALGAAGTAGSQANSNFVSLDAIERIKVNVSPYDIRQSGFTGGLVNAITRGGTNTWLGSVFAFGRNQDLVGRSPDASRRPFENFSDVQFGGRIGGPILTDVLHMHVTAEIRLRSLPLEVGLNDPQALVNFPVAQRTFDSVIAISKRVHQFDPGTYGNFNNESNSYNVIARLDYNISESHKLQFRHNFTYGTQTRNLQRDQFTYSLTSRLNTFESINNQTVLQLNSLLAPDVSNEFRISFTQTNDARLLPTSPFPEVRIQVGSGQNIAFGPERSSQANALDQSVLALTNDATFYQGSHTITLGTHNELQQFNNLFIQDFYGSYQFASLEDFADSVANFYRVSYANTSVTGGQTQPRAAWSMAQAGLYIMDEWDVASNLRVTGGLRVDVPIFVDEPFFNPAFSQAFPGRATNQTPSIALLYSPRIGFNWDVFENKQVQLRGGSGLFTGRVAAVWLSNQYSNTGVDIFRAQLGGNNSQNPITDSLRNSVRWNLSGSAPRPGDPGYPGAAINTSVINITDPNFRTPQVWRNTLGADVALHKGITLTIEGMYGAFLNQVDYQNINLKRSNATFVNQGTAYVGISPVDGRPLYQGENADSLQSRLFTQVLVLSSRDAGYQYSAMAQIQIQENNNIFPGVSAMFAYTHGGSQDLTSSTAATALSQWNGTDAIDPNNLTVSRSNFDTPHRLSINASYRIRWAEDFSTTIGLFYSGNSGRPYSLSYINDYNGDNATGGNDLIYVPKREDLNTKVVIVPPTGTDLRTPDQVWEQIMRFVESNDVLREHQGNILPRNAMREPFVHQLDLRIAQKIPSFSSQSFELTLDVQNLLNLLHSEWGLQRFVNFQSFNIFGLGLQNGKPFDSQGRLRMTYSEPITNGTPGVFIVDNFFSRWRMQLGVRYSF
jgi:outer membrane receptor for ferrienterochelin and colicin